MTTTTPPDASPDAAPDATPPALFDTLPLSPATLANLQSLGYLSMTPVQAAALPLALAGRDLIAQAKTGSGKTAAFALPLLARLNPRWFSPQALVLCPTRELADQVAKEIRRLARATDNIKVVTLCGGAKMGPQIGSLEHGAHVAVGTPGRIMDHLERGTLDLRGLNTLVLDEADRMLDMGFFDDITFVARQCPASRQTLLFSATFPAGIETLAGQFLREPERVQVETRHTGGKIRQRFYEVENTGRLDAVARLLRHYRPVSTLAFCNTKLRCRELADRLRAQGFEALALYGDMEQRERDQVLVRFAHRSASVLVATDVAARGLDIDKLEAVINVDVTPDPEVHVHRIGRTGRGDAEGWALSLVSPNEMARALRIGKAQGASLEWQALADAEPAGDAPLVPPMTTLQILGGRKEKMRPGDVLGALTGEAGFTREQVGRIDVTDYVTYVAVERNIADEVVRRLDGGRVKGRDVKVKRLDE
ncbi:MAG: ATP-dependent RNA helicase DbpA [Gammaproteobacteria bacterium]|jgi:ATP-dependent RNA helicase DbpA|nr:ATP-dependent RNA helicase DbpA [Gammaproteobacteria bacterium]MBU0857871.1 ATP-dependent RNA helicase DbpA [Gammaproteobacteria bacterium]MBU1848387.1 ATP-dependent RNA helicase DbpA [Gammaproteobacteria bacterium]